MRKSILFGFAALTMVSCCNNSGCNLSCCDNSKNPVLTIEGGNHKIADTVIATASNPDRKVLTMNSMQSVTAEDVENGMTYLSMMEENLTALKEALN